uniref:Uncharacterized protein n=1 Tax=Rhizophora mucronata TaxID=61149 RepID=A0A2P2N8R3_RHIMU
MERPTPEAWHKYASQIALKDPYINVNYNKYMFHILQLFSHYF